MPKINDNSMPTIQVEVTKLEPGPGDLLVCKLPVGIDAESARDLAKYLRNEFDCCVVVLNANTDLSMASDEDLQAAGLVRISNVLEMLSNGDVK